MRFFLCKDNDEKKLFSYSGEFDGYKFNYKKEKNLMQVSHITVVNPRMIDSILSVKFNKRFNKLLKYINYLLNSDDSDSGNIAIALNEVALLRGILLNRYQKFLNQEKEELFLRKLRIVENELRLKEVMILASENSYDEEKGKSR